MPPVGVMNWYNLTYMYFPTVNSGLDMAPDGNIYGYGGLQSKYGISNATGNSNKYTESLTFGEDISGQQIYTYFPSNTTSNYSTNYGIYVYPNQRSLHTFTALEPDYCFTFDYTKGTWAKVNFQGGDPGARYGHSAVLYKDALFIMFGANASGQMQNSVYVMNTTTFTWSQVPITTNSTGTGSTGGGGSSISGGTIAGIVVGVVAGVALIGGLVFFLVRRGTFSSNTGNQFSAPIYGNEGFGDDFARPTDTRFDQPASGMRMVSPHGPSTVSDTYEVMSQPSQLTSNYDGATVIKPTEGSVADGSVKPTEYAYSQVVKPTEYEYSQVVKPTEYVQQTYTGKPDGF
ncbi:hypothetical protein BC940DRAFT_39949 [Gongronella butleri]|nr:hypothetical protein BC940DRAFT_39949 [Gongronella butleri]